MTRESPVKDSLPQPAYLPGSSPHKDQSQAYHQSKRPHHLTTQSPGFGSRHDYDIAPFTLWDYASATFREPLARELEWMFATYRAKAIHVDLPDIIIETDKPPTEIPLTIGGALARFVLEDMVVRNVPVGCLRPYPNSQRGDLLSSPLPLYSIPRHHECHEIIRLLELEIRIRAIHFLSPQIIVELDVTSGKKYDRHSLPSRAGGISIQYHESNESFWEGTSQIEHEKLTTPTDTAAEISDYLYKTPCKMSPGVRLASSLVSDGNSPTSTWLNTSASLLLQKAEKSRVRFANHGFPDSLTPHHPSPTGRQISQITDRFPGFDKTLAHLDPFISLSNDQHFAAPRPWRLICVEEIQAGDWFQVDTYSTGKLDLCARGRCYIRPKIPEGVEPSPVPYDYWCVVSVYSLFGRTGASSREGICGAPVVDQMGRVAGMIGMVDRSGMWAHTAGLDSLINNGWSLL